MMREIGGYIELDNSTGEEYHKAALALNSGRHCLEYLIKAKSISKIFLPEFLCASVSDLCEKCRCEYEYYSIGKDFKPLFNDALKENEYLYLVNYYGQISNEVILQYKGKFGNIIIDNAQDFFRSPVDGVDTLYTCRKFFGVSDGGYLYTDKFLTEQLPIDESYERVHYILGRYERGAAEFYQESADNNKYFKTESLKEMSKLTHNLLRNIDYEFVKSVRRGNFEFLHENLQGINNLDLIVPDGAFMYPLYIDNGADLRKKLIYNKIFVPTLWGDVFNIADECSLEYSYAQNIVPLPVDQRYNLDDMKYILEVIGECTN